MPRRYRTIWISDLHLGTRAASARALLDFLSRHEAERYYLVGDIVDGWALRRSWYWPASHNDVVRALLQQAGRSEVIYVPGNHDEAARQFPGLALGGITIMIDVVHTTADGRRFLVLHGDEFDGVVRHARWVSKLGGWAYERDVDGVVCGHIHVPALRRVRGVAYANAGDWVEHCTALVENLDGSLSLAWGNGQASPASEVAPPASSTTGTDEPQDAARDFSRVLQ